MSSVALHEELDMAVEAMLADGLLTCSLDPDVEPLATLGDELRTLADPTFREQLRLNLAAQAERQYHAATPQPWTRLPLGPVPAHRASANAEWQDSLHLFETTATTFAVHRSPFVVSAGVHIAALALVLYAGLWAVEHKHDIGQQVVSLVGGLREYPLTVSKAKSGGGGGGGDRDLLPVSKGTPPRFAKEQIVPPEVVIRNDNPKLTADARVVGPPEIDLSQAAKLGDLSGILGSASNGTGSGGGIGTGSGGGVGSGTGPGVGAGHGGGYGGGAYRVGGGVSAPRAIYAPDPDYSEEARKAKHQGTVVLWVVVGPDGRCQQVRVQRALGMGLDEKAIEAVRQWRFAPALKDGRAVPVQIYVEVNFRLY